MLRSTNVLVATGSKATRLPALESWYEEELGGHLRCYDSDSIKKLSFLPRSVVIVGGGIIAVEFARIFAALAAKVTMIVRADNLPTSLARVGIDSQIAQALQADLQAVGVRLIFESEVGAIDQCASSRTKNNRRRRIEVDVRHSRTGDKRPSILADMILTATGRRAVSTGLGLDEALKANGDIEVGADLQCSTAGVYAAGDVVGAPQLASTGIAQAEAATATMFDASAAPSDLSPSALVSDSARYPIGIWTVPEVAFVGLSYDAARAAPHRLDVVEGVGRYATAAAHTSFLSRVTSHVA